MKSYTLVLAAVLLLLVACSEQPVNPDDGMTSSQLNEIQSPSGTPDIDLKDRYIVVFKKDVGNPDRVIDEMAQGNGVKVHFRYRSAIKGFAATVPEQALNGLRHNPNVDFIEPDGIMETVAQSNPPSWGLDRIDQHSLPLNQQYSFPNNGSGVTVYIIDSGIRFDHQEFGNRAVSGWDFVDNDADASDCYGHGTHVAGIVGGATVGVAKGVSLVALRVGTCLGYGSSSWTIAAIDWVIQHHSGPSVINMSIEGPVHNSTNLAVDNASAAGIVCIAAAGNSNVDAATVSPASASTSITVGATTSADARAYYSNFGSTVDLFAPGSYIYSSTMNGTNTYASWSGTSMATPHVAGVAALYLSAHPTATPAQVESALKAAATSGVLSGIGSGSPNLLLYNQVTTPSTGTAPVAPSGLSATAASYQTITLSWTDNSNDESGFNVDRSTDGTTWSQIASLSANSTSFSDSPLSQSSTYYYRVRAYNNYGSSGWSNTASAATPAYPTIPTAPTLLSATATSYQSIALSWTDNSNDESGFVLERSEDGSSWTQITTTGANTTSYSDSPLQSSKTYYYRVKAYNTYGSSSWSSTASATTQYHASISVHVSLVNAYVAYQRNKWEGHLQVTVVNASNQPVQNAAVSFSWDGKPGGGETVTTNASGECEVVTAQFNRNLSSITMTVTDITGSGISYDASANTATLPVVLQP